MRKEVQSISSEKIQLEVKLKYELRTNHQEASLVSNAANKLSSLQKTTTTTATRGTTNQAAEGSSSALKDEKIDEDDFIPFGTFQPRFKNTFFIRSFLFLFLPHVTLPLHMTFKLVYVYGQRSRQYC